MTDSPTERRLLEAACEIAREAGRAILDVYGRPDFAVERKSDDSPLTEADQVAHGIITRALAKLDAGLPILSEESAPTDRATRRNWQRYWLVDPLDGTKEFVKRNGEFTVNIALVQDNQPIAGFIYAPVPQILYYATQPSGAFRQQLGEEAKAIRVEKGSRAFTVVRSRSHAD